jgi:putative transposase
MLSIVTDETAVADGRSMLDEICREGARKMLAAALEAEVDAYLAELRDERDEDGHVLVTRNGHARPRNVQTVAGAVAIRAPRVNDRRIDPATGEKAKFKSSIVPPWCRRPPLRLERVF